MPPFPVRRFPDQMVDIEDNTVADVATDTITNDARRHEIQLEDISRPPSVTGVVTPWKRTTPWRGRSASRRSCPYLVAPLGAHHDDILGHFLVPILYSSIIHCSPPDHLRSHCGPAGGFTGQHFHDNFPCSRSIAICAASRRSPRRRWRQHGVLRFANRHQMVRREFAQIQRKPVAGRARPKVLLAPS